MRREILELTSKPLPQLSEVQTIRTIGTAKKHFGRKRSNKLTELRELEALSFALGFAVGPKWRGRYPRRSDFQ